MDIKRRRLTGRDQILSGGEHLIDGVPFGRHRLRAPRGRPAVHIAPRKRRRLEYDQDRDADDLDDYFDEDEDLDVYTGSSRPPHHDEEDEEEGEPLLLTQSDNKPNQRRVRFPASATSGVDSEDSEGSADEEGSAADDEDEEDVDDEENAFDPDAQELADELQDLRELAEEEAREKSPSEADGHDRFHTPSENVRQQAEEQDVSSLGNEHKAASRTRSARQTRSHSAASPMSIAGRGSRGSDAVESDATTHCPTSSLDSSLLDKVTAIRSAFPLVSSRDCQKLLIKHGKDVSKTWRTLEKSLTPRQGLAETMVLSTQLELPREFKIISSPVRELAGHLGEVSRIEEDEESNSSSGEQGDSDASVSSSDEKNDDSDESDGNDSSSEATPTCLSPRVKEAVQESREDSSEDDSDSDSPSEDDDHIPQPTTKDERLDSSDSSDEESSSSESSSDSDAPVVQRVNNARPNRRRVIQSSQASPASSKAAKASPKRAPARTERDVSASSKAATVESSSSSSDSDSDSDSDEPEAQSSRPTAVAATKPSARAPSMAASQASTQQHVPPGQGRTKTQRRNQRRRLEKQHKKLALELASSVYHQSQDSTVSDMLMAKKNALLQTLGSQSQVASEGAKDTSLPAAEIAKSTATPSKGPDDWKQKISYRAVECMQEGIVDISEPPFPFYQRWDPQLRQDWQSASKRKNKRKARDDSQFYGSSSQPSFKRRKEDEHSRQVIDEEYSYQDETTTFLAHQDDITLDYDEYPVKEVEKDDADDLPQLPEDVSLLPELLLKDLAAGAIVAWKQLLCTEATNWQPQLSEYLTAVVIEADCVKGHLQAQLAKRDRDIEKSQKKFDEETGERIYGKFEVPDEDEEEEEEDQGFRDLVLSQMMHARLLKPAEQPHEADQVTGDAEKRHALGEDKNGGHPDQAPQTPEGGVEVADSQPHRNSHGLSGTSGSDQNQSRTLDHDTQSRKDQQDLNESQDMGPDDASPSGAIDESFIDETSHDIPMEEEYDDPPASIIPAFDQVSITDERREEINQLMEAEGFRQDIRSSIVKSDFLNLGSPSRQLEEEYASSLQHKASSRAASAREASSEAPSEYGSKDPSQQMQQQSMDVDADAFHSAPETPRNRAPSPDGPEDEQTGKIGPSTERVKSSQVTEVSAQSGRQPDDNFISHSDDLGIYPPTESPGMVTFDDENDAVMGDVNSPKEPAADRSQTPTQQTFNDDLQTRSATKAAASRSNLQGPVVSSPPGSVHSPASTDDSFPNIEVLWERMATKKFTELPVGIKNEPASQVNMPSSRENLPRPVQAASPQRGVKEESWSSPARSTRSSKRKNSTPKAKSRVATLNASISPPARSKPWPRPTIPSPS